jgi:hypothetical protein
MADEPIATTTPPTLVEELADRTGLSWIQLSGGVGLGLALLLVGTAYLGRVLSGPFDYELWSEGLTAPVLVAYVLAIQPILRRLRERAIEAFRPLVQLDDREFSQLLAEAALFNRRYESLAVGLSLAGTLLLSRPWDLRGPFWAGESGWLMLNDIASAVILWGLLGWFAYSSLASTRLFSQLRLHTADVNVFELDFLEPIGRWSLGIALAFMGGNTLSLLFLPGRALDAQIVVVYVPLILVPVLVFFLNMMSTHNVIVEAKEREMKIVRDGLAAASQRLKLGAAQDGVVDMAEPFATFASWVAVENRLREVPEWPYTQSILRSLVASAVVPVAVLVAQGVLFELLVRWLSLGGS